MALVLKDRAKETCTGTSGDMALTGAVSGFVAFSVIGNAKETYYVLEDADGTKWEVGIGTYTLSGTTFSRDTILANQAGDTTTQTFSGGTHTIFCGYPAGKAVYLDASGNLSHTVDISSDTNLVGGTGITLTGDTLSTTDSEIAHDSLSGFVAAEHVDWAGASAGTIHATNYTDTTYTKASFDLDHLFTLVDATADTSEHLGTFTGSTISDSVTIKAALQALETAVETKTSNTGDMTGVDLTAGTGITIDSETNTTSGDYSATITCTVTDTNTMGSGFTVSATTDTTATTITQGDDLFFAAGTGITCETTADGTVTISSTVTDTDTTYSAATNSVLGLMKLEDGTEQTTAANAVSTTAGRTYGIQFNSSDEAVVNVPWTDTDTNTMGSGFTVSATTDTTPTTITQGDDLMFTAGTGITCETTSDGTVTISCTVTDTDTNTMGSGFTVSATTDTTATTITQGDDLMFAAGTGITCETTADGTVTISSTVTDTNTMGSGFTVSATTDSNATTITQGDDLMFAAGTGITCETTADGTVTISSTVTDTNTEYTAGTLLDLSSTTFNVDLSEALAAVMAEADEFIFLDNDDSSAAKRESLSDLLDTVAGTVGTTGLDRSGATLVVSDLHPVGVSGSADQLLTDDGDGTVTSEANLTFDGGILTLNGGLVKNTDTVTAATYTVDATGTDSIILCDATANAIDITLPDAAAGIVGRILTIKKIDSSTNTVDIIGSTGGGYGADDIDEFNLKYTLYAQHDTITIVCGEGDGTASDYQWWIIAQKLKPHVAKVYSAAAQTGVTTSAWDQVTFDTSEHLVGLTWTDASDKITITRPGYYHIHAQISLDLAANQDCYLAIGKNGATSGAVDDEDLLNVTANSRPDANIYQECSVVDFLAVGDYITLHVWHNKGTTASTIVSGGTAGGDDLRTKPRLSVYEIIG